MTTVEKKTIVQGEDSKTEEQDEKGIYTYFDT